MTYRLHFYNLSAVIRKYFTFLYVEEKIRIIFTPAPFVSFRPGYSLRNHLVRAEVYTHLLEKKVHFVVGRENVKLAAT